MNITITIQNPTQEAVLALAGVVASYNEQAAAVVVEEPKIGTQTEPQSQETPSEKPKRQRNSSTNKPAPQPEPTPEPEEDNTSQDEDSADSDEASKYIPDVVEIRAKAQEIGAQPGGKKAVKALLDKYEVPSVSAIPENKRAEFLDELNGLNAS